MTVAVGLSYMAFIMLRYVSGWLAVGSGDPGGKKGSSWHGWLRGPGCLKSGVCPLVSGPRSQIHWMRASSFPGAAVCLLVGRARVQGTFGVVPGVGPEISGCCTQGILELVWCCLSDVWGWILGLLSEVPKASHSWCQPACGCTGSWHVQAEGLWCSQDWCPLATK